jgi:hypothetical protein
MKAATAQPNVSRTGTGDGNQRSLAPEASDANEPDCGAAVEMARRTREALRVPSFHGYDASEVGARGGGEAEGSAIRRLTEVGADGRAKAAGGRPRFIVHFGTARPPTCIL